MKTQAIRNAAKVFSAIAALVGALFLLAGSAALAGDKTAVPFETYTGYFVSNKFEPDAASSFVIIQDQAHFDRVFGTAFVMPDKARRLPPNVFKSHLIIAGAIDVRSKRLIVAPNWDRQGQAGSGPRCQIPPRRLQLKPQPVLRRIPRRRVAG